MLQDYRHGQGILTQLELASLDETDVDPIYEAWCDLPAAERSVADEDFQIIHSLADESGIMMILEESKAQGQDARSDLDELSDFHDKAIWSFLNLRECFETALRFREADDLSAPSFRQRIFGIFETGHWSRSDACIAWRTESR